MSDHRSSCGPRLARRLRLFATIATTFAAGTLATKSAHAQAWLRDKSFSEGIGIRVGDTELHPSVGAEVGYDSNWFQRSHKDTVPNPNPTPTLQNPNIVNAAPDASIRQAAQFRITPAFSFGSLGASRLGGAQPSFAYKGSIAGSYRELIGKEVDSERNMNVHAHFRGDVLPGRPVGFGFFAGYQRFVQPTAAAQIAGIGSRPAFNRSDLNAGGEVIFTPGSGTFDMHLGYQFYGALYEESSALTNLMHEVSIKNRWKFRPKSSVFTETSLQALSYPNSTSGQLLLADSLPLRMRAGINTLLLPRLQGLVSAGYSTTFQMPPKGQTANQVTSLSQYDSLNAQVEATLFLTGSANPNEEQGGGTAVSTLTLGYSRDVLTGSAQSFASRPSYIFGGGQNTALGGFSGLDKIYGRLAYLWGNRATLSLDGYLDIQSLPPFFGPGATAPAPGTASGYTNFRPGGSLFAEYRFVDTFGVNITVDYQQNISEVRLPVDPSGTQVFDLNYRRVQAYLGARWFM